MTNASDGLTLKHSRRGALRGLAALFCAALASTPAFGQEQRWRERRRREALERWRARDPEFRRRVIEGVRRGEIRRLRELKAMVEARGGELLDAELFETPEGWIYTVRVLTPRGRVRDLTLDARSLRPIAGPAYGGPPPVGPPPF